MNSLGFRACLEKVATVLDIKLTKKKRRSLPANACEDVQSYSRAVLSRLRSDNQEELNISDVSRYDLQSADAEKIETQMELCYREHSGEFHLLELLTGLQFLLQTVIENLITLDRLLFLQEHTPVSESGVCQIFDPLISPRNKVIYVTRR